MVVKSFAEFKGLDFDEGSFLKIVRYGKYFVAGSIQFFDGVLGSRVAVLEQAIVKFDEQLMDGEVAVDNGVDDLIFRPFNIHF